jgi:L-fuculokinase
MSKKVVLVMDCGATNVRAVAVDETGELLAIHSLPNNTQPDPHYNGGLIWDVNEIWQKLITCTKEVLKKVPANSIAGITVTTFGVNGAPMDKNGNLLYPVISWQCNRTTAIMQNIDKYIKLKELYQINGLQPFNFNTINYLLWFKENKPEILEKMDYFVFIPSILIYFLTNEFSTDTSMAGTSMLTDLKTRDFSSTILNTIGISKDKFPNYVEPGEIVGKTTAKIAELTGLPEGIPVITAGHDTQFAIFGSGANENEPVVSTGTWEILMVRTPQINNSDELLKTGVTIEFDAIKGLLNPGCQWVASGILEWIKRNFYGNEQGDAIYEKMIGQAEKVKPGCNGVTVNPNFFADTGNEIGKGAINGLTLHTLPEEVYRATLEALSYKLKKGLRLLEKACGFKAESLIIVGGGSKNRLWNQIRADVLNIPIKIIDKKETTVLGAALFAFSGLGYFKSPKEARNTIGYKTTIINPSANSSVYENLYIKSENSI